MIMDGFLPIPFMDYPEGSCIVRNNVFFRAERDQVHYFYIYHKQPMFQESL